MIYTHLFIEYCDPNNLNDTHVLSFKLRDNKFVNKWVNRVLTAKQSYNIDDPGRFYGFGSIEYQTNYALNQINLCINTINDFEPIINKKLIDINDQDTLNYLHHIFEVYHGLLDQQTHELWNRAPEPVKKSLANLNLLVHRCESIGHGAKPRHVVTWYGLPKTELLDIDDYSLFDSNISFGTVYLNYVEIGKTLDNLAVDNDLYIGDDAFQPYRHYSADFNVKFWNSTSEEINKHLDRVKHYYDSNQDFFIKRDLKWGHPYLNSGAIPLADLINCDNAINLLSTRQWVKSVYFN